jgi:translation initiation factor IF-1
MPDQDTVEVEGRIVAVLPGTMFRVELTNGHQVLAHISGKLRKHFIRITVGDIVKMEMNTHDLEKARITFRLRDSGTLRFASDSVATRPGAPAGQSHATRDLREGREGLRGQSPTRGHA